MHQRISLSYIKYGDIRVPTVTVEYISQSLYIIIHFRCLVCINGWASNEQSNMQVEFTVWFSVQYIVECNMPEISRCDHDNEMNFTKIIVFSSANRPNRQSISVLINNCIRISSFSAHTKRLRANVMELKRINVLIIVKLTLSTT